MIIEPFTSLFTSSPEISNVSAIPFSIELSYSVPSSENVKLSVPVPVVVSPGAEPPVISAFFIVNFLFISVSLAFPSLSKVLLYPTITSTGPVTGVFAVTSHYFLL